MPESGTDLLRSMLPDSPDMLHRNQEPEPARKQMISLLWIALSYV